MSVTVFLQEEYGYRHWLWETGMDADALMKWWADQRIAPTSDYFFDPRKLPGKLTSLYDLAESPYEIEAILLDSSLSDDERDSKIRALAGSPPRWIKTDDDGPNADAKVLDVPALTGGWKAHIHMNDDSWIMPPEEEKVWLNQSES